MMDYDGMVYGTKPTPSMILKVGHHRVVPYIMAVLHIEYYSLNRELKDVHVKRVGEILENQVQIEYQDADRILIICRCDTRNIWPSTSALYFI